MPSRHDLKNKVLKTAKQAAKQAAETAKTGLDQALLKLEHPAVKKMTERVANDARVGETKDMITRLSHRILEQASVIRASLDPAVLKPVADIVTEEVKSQIKAVKADPKGSVEKATRAASAVAVKAAKGARKFGTSAAKQASKTAKTVTEGAVAKAKRAAGGGRSSTAGKPSKKT